MSSLDAANAAVLPYMSACSAYSLDVDGIVLRPIESSRGVQPRPVVADPREQPGSGAPAMVLRVQVYTALEADPQLAADPADMVDAPRPARYDVTVGHAENLQIGNGNVQRIASGGGSVWPRRRNVILTVFSNPYGTDGLRLDEESRAITQAVQQGRYRERLDLVTAPAARYDELGPAIQYHRPAVVHIGIHGSPTGALVFADRAGSPFEVSTTALAALFASHASTIRCVVLNGCFTKRLADAIAASGPCVVGTSRAIPDALAIEFAGAFYTAVANGRRFDEAFADGRNRLDLGDRAGGDAIVFAEGRAGGCGTAID